MRVITSIIKYQVHDTFRSKWLFIYTIFFAILSYGLVSFSSDSSKVILSLLNVNTIFIPLAGLIFGTIYFYNNKEYVILILSQPINRTKLFIGLYLGLSIPMSIGFIIGTTLPLIFFLKDLTKMYEMLFYLILGGVFETFIFVSLSFLIATINENRMKGLGLAIFLWLLFTVIYDGAVLLTLQTFRNYPLDVFSIVFTVLNPVDIARLLVIIKFDISALMGYTGALFISFLGSGFGILISFISLFLWTLLPLYVGLRWFAKKDF
jgi:Cu-processing system permease protein